MVYYVYILTNSTNTVMYIGFTNDLYRRVHEHKQGLTDGFTKKYHVNKLVYFEQYKNPLDAIRREKQLKCWRREKKNALVTRKNAEWKDLYSPFIS